MLAKQAKILNAGQIRAMISYLDQTRHPVRNRVILFLSVRAGLRAKEIAALTWAMVTDAEGELTNSIRLTDGAAKGRTGGVIPMARELRAALEVLLIESGGAVLSSRIVKTDRASTTSAQVIVNLFGSWYRKLGFDGCSSHSGRRTFITNAARNIGRVGGSMRDVQALARHSSLSTTQQYIEISTDALERVVNL